MSDFDNLIQVDAVLEQERKNRQALLFLLDAQREKKDHLTALEVRMGATRSFVTSVSLEWAAQRVRLATELPLFKDYKDPETGKIRLDGETAALVQQREPDWRRQFPMTLYLANRVRHKFPPLLLVATQAWVDVAAADEWGGEKRALRDSINIQSLDSVGHFVDLHMMSGDLLYAIDGQHRLMAIKGLSELLNSGKLHARDQQCKELARKITLDEIVEKSHGTISHGQLQQLLAERIGVEIIPAVMKGETRVDALRRIRSIFVHVNRTAKPLTEGELALLDEDDGFAVTARVLMVSHPLLQGRVQLKKGQLLPSSTDLTSLETLKSVAQEYLGQFSEFKSWEQDSKTEMAIRPEEESLDAGYIKLTQYFDALSQLSGYARVIQGKSPKAMREEEGHLLFRPLGQLALAEAVGYLVADRKRSLDTTVERLKGAEARGQLDCRDPRNPWFGVVFDGKNMVRSEGARRLCARLLMHLLGGGTADDKAYNELRDDFSKARVMDVTSGYAVNLEGKSVAPEGVELPAPW